MSTRLTAEQVQELWKKGERDRRFLQWSDLKNLCDTTESLRAELVAAHATAQHARIMAQAADTQKAEAKHWRARAESSEAALTAVREALQARIEATVTWIDRKHHATHPSAWPTIGKMLLEIRAQLQPSVSTGTGREGAE